MRFVLALYRARSVARAAQGLGVNATTVVRRVRRVEASMGAQLFTAGARGAQDPSDAMLSILPQLEATEQAQGAIAEALGAASGAAAGRVRLSTVPILLNRVLVPQLGTLRAQHPELMLELSPSARAVDLSRREADIALRFARPVNGGLSTLAKRLGTVGFGLYAAPNAAPGWIGYEADFAGLPQAQWLDQVAGPDITLRVADAHTALEATAAGLGKTLLPRIVAKRDPRLFSVSPQVDDPPLPQRDVWLLSHVELAGRGSVQVVKDWLEGLGWF